tara:strand:- start:1818 stop:2219 length:402 start_codon:yes stop_codon:yes gene_type:complete
MKDREREILSQINSTYDLDLKETVDEYSRFDAENYDYIVEIKKRFTFYKDTLIEFDKYTFNKEYAKLMAKAFIYVVGYDNKVYIFNISKLDASKHNYKWHWKTMPKQTEFSQTEEISKFVGYIDVEKSIDQIY